VAWLEMEEIKELIRATPEKYKVLLGTQEEDQIDEFEEKNFSSLEK
jgi:hypothetical protein